MIAKLARALVALMSVECLTASAAFAYTGNWKMSLYWVCAACINAIAYTF